MNPAPEKLRERYAPGIIPVPAEDIAKQLGAEVIRHRHRGHESCFVLRDGKRVIVAVNSNTSRRRQRTAVGHAIGHMLIHNAPLIVCSAVRFPGNSGVTVTAALRLEVEACQFAGDLLLPASAVTTAVAALENQAGDEPRGNTVTRLARQFDVSDEYVCWRMVTLGLLVS